MNSRITPPIITGNTGAIRPADVSGNRQPSQGQTQEIKQYYAPNRAQTNFIPSPDSLDNMINRAVEARGKGVYWDRGSILNLVV